MKLTVMTYNVRVGIETSLDTIISDLRAGPSVDLIAFQEIGVNWNMGECVDQPRYLAEGLGLDHVVFAGALTDGRGGQFGIALASRFPIISHQVTPHYREDDEQRVLLEALVDGPIPFTVLTSHLSIAQAERLKQAQTMAERGAGISGPMIVLGDFNARPESEVYSVLSHHFRDCFAQAGEGPTETFSVKEPHRQIDYIMVGGIFEPGTRAWVDRSVTASDHFPVIAEIHVPRMET